MEEIRKLYFLCLVFNNTIKKKFNNGNGRWGKFREERGLLLI